MEKKSNYLVFSDGHKIVLSLLSGSLIKFETAKFNCLKENDLSIFTEKEKETLKSLGFIVDFNELDYLLKRKENAQEKNILSLTILTTTKCNAHCNYCFEKGIKPIMLTDETIQSIKDYLILKKSKKIMMNWYGGEPLLNTDAINEICNFLKENQIVFNSRMITNGYLIDKHISELLTWNMRNIQITLDGTGDTYNKIKRFHNSDSNPFSHVIENVGLLLEKRIHVTIRLNFSSTNYNDILETIDFIYGKFGNHPKLKVYVAHIFTEDPIDYGEIYLILYKKLFEKGYIKTLKDIHLSPVVEPCGIIDKGYTAIYPNGDLYKCECSVGSNQNCYGNINTKELDQTVLDQWECVFYPQKCLNCIALPVCQGGCKYQDSFSNGCLKTKNHLQELLNLYCYYKKV